MIWGPSLKGPCHMESRVFQGDLQEATSTLLGNRCCHHSPARWPGLDPRCILVSSAHPQETIATSRWKEQLCLQKRMSVPSQGHAHNQYSKEQTELHNALHVCLSLATFYKRTVFAVILSESPFSLAESVV